MDDIKNQVREQFGKTAEAYAVSAIHAKGSDLQRLLEIAEPKGTEKVLDVATAAGHTLFTFAPQIASGVGLDLTAEMIALATTRAAEKNITNVSFVQGDAEKLPFDDAEFDIVTARICVHHFPHPEQAMAEMARVLKPGGLLLVVDNYAPEEDAADRFINQIEKLRDPSHVREWKMSEWRRFYEQAGLQVEVLDGNIYTQMELSSWTERSQTPADVVAQIEQELETSSVDVREILGIRKLETGDWAFQLRKLIAAGRKK